MFEGRKRKEGEETEQEEDEAKEEIGEDERGRGAARVAVGGSTDEDAEEGEKLVGEVANDSGEFLVPLSFGASVVWSAHFIFLLHSLL